MKKLILITITALVCLCLAGCADDTVTPNELTEQPVVTPNEPIESPTEPEIPTEPKDNVIMLPEADENTRYITIEFPEDFPEEPYVEPNLVSPEEFEWGEYGMLVQMSGVEHLTASEDIYAMAIFSKETADLIEARQIYSEFNEKYLVESRPEVDYVDADRAVSEYPEILEYFSQSNIVYSTPELDKMIRYSVVPIENDTKNYMYSYFICEYINNGEVVFTEQLDYIKEPLFYNSESYAKHPYEISNSNDFFKDCYLYYDENNCHFQLYCLNELKMLYDISLSSDYRICDYNRYGIIIESKSFPSNTFYYDFANKKMVFVDSTVFNQSLSPDGKHIAYTSADYDCTPEYKIKEEGIYIKNLATEDVTFFSYPYDNYRWLDINCWLKNDYIEN